MRIVKAQKMIKRIKGEIAEIQSRISGCISSLEENEYESDFPTLMRALDEKIHKLIELKVRVMKANIENKAFTDILVLGELKSRLELIRGFNITAGVVRSGYNEEKTKYKSQITTQEKMTMLESYQKDINDLTDKLDDFNAITDISDVEIQTPFRGKEG